MFKPVIVNDKVNVGSEPMRNFIWNIAGKYKQDVDLLTKAVNKIPFIETTKPSVINVEGEFANDKDVELVSFTVTPWIDNPELLKRYKKDFTLNSNNWTFLTGDKNKIYKLARESYFAEEEIGFTKDSSDFLHTEHFLLIDKKMHIRGIYNGTLKLEMSQIIKDIQTLKELG